MYKQKVLWCCYMVLSIYGLVVFGPAWDGCVKASGYVQLLLKDSKGQTEHQLGKAVCAR